MAHQHSDTDTVPGLDSVALARWFVVIENLLRSERGEENSGSGPDSVAAVHAHDRRRTSEEGSTNWGARGGGGGGHLQPSRNVVRQQQREISSSTPSLALAAALQLGIVRAPVFIPSWTDSDTGQKGRGRKEVVGRE